MEGVRPTPLYVALWRSDTEAWRIEHGVRPLTPQALGSQAVLVALHPEGTEVVFGEDGTNRLSLAVDNAVLIPTSRGYRLVNRGGQPKAAGGGGHAPRSEHEAPRTRTLRSRGGGGQTGGHVGGP